MTHLEAAIPFATEPMAKALAALVRFYRTGETADREAYDIAWVQDKSSPVDTINGFTEVYLDARGVKGAWEALVYYVNPEKTEGIRKLAGEAQWFEDRMPWDPKYRKKGVRGHQRQRDRGGGRDGRIGPHHAGRHQPAERPAHPRAARQQVGLALERERGVRQVDAARVPRGVLVDDGGGGARQHVERARRRADDEHARGDRARRPGKIEERLKGNAAAALKEQYSALEESRADLVGLYFLPDPKLVELGLVPKESQQEIVLAEYEGYTRNALVQLRRIREGNQIEEDHMRNRQMIVRWLMANTKAIETRERDGKTFYVMIDAVEFRDGVARLLAEVQRIKSQGDYAAAKALFETHGVTFDPALRDQVVARVARLDLPSYTGFVMPKLQPAMGPDGAITDVAISYPRDLTAQMLEYSGRRK